VIPNEMLSLVRVAMVMMFFHSNRTLTKTDKDTTALFLLDIFFIYISNVIPFPSFPSKNPLSSPLSPTHKPTHSCFLALAFPYTEA
jgi:F0F1-type ATP synthase membrane subunit a